MSTLTLKTMKMTGALNTMILTTIGNNFNFRIHLLFPNKQITMKRYEY